MPGKHRDGYHADYYQRRKQERRAAERLRNAHPDEYDQYLAEERDKETDTR